MYCKIKNETVFLIAIRSELIIWNKTYKKRKMNYQNTNFSFLIKSKAFKKLNHRKLQKGKLFVHHKIFYYKQTI